MEEKPIRRVKKVEEELPSTDRPKRQRIQKTSSNPAELPLIPYEPKIPVEQIQEEAPSGAPVPASSETATTSETSSQAGNDLPTNPRSNNRPGNDRPAKNFRPRKGTPSPEEAP